MYSQLNPLFPIFLAPSVEQIGDIPDVEIKPPDNVLFVCKLNPVTEVSCFSFFDFL